MGDSYTSGNRNYRAPDKKNPIRAMSYRAKTPHEIKGGKDISNIHNRIGEAEKSHQKARKRGFVECWTMVGVGHTDMDLARKESPSTDRF